MICLRPCQLEGVAHIGVSPGAAVEKEPLPPVDHLFADPLFQYFQGMLFKTAALRYIEQEEYVDEFEMHEIRENQSLSDSIERGLAGAKEKRGRFV